MDTKYAQKILDKLQNFSIQCGGARLHDAKVHMAVLSGYIHYTEKGIFTQANLDEAVSDAEKFMIREAK